MTNFVDGLNLFLTTILTNVVNFLSSFFTTDIGIILICCLVVGFLISVIFYILSFFNND